MLELTSAIAAAFALVASVARLGQPLALVLCARRVWDVHVHDAEERERQTVCKRGDNTAI